MRYLVISDVHGNHEALITVLEDADGGYDKILNLGDLVGYGPRPVEVIDELMGRPVISVLGNHDQVAIGRATSELFNEYAAQAIGWTSDLLLAFPEQLDWLSEVPKGPVEVEPGLWIVHASPDEPIWTYLDRYNLSTQAYFVWEKMMKAGTVFFGHTHRPAYLTCDYQDDGEDMGFPVDLTGIRFVNPGSVGQPRDGDPRSAYIIYDSGTGEVERFRVEYDIGIVAIDIDEADGLPYSSGSRLFYGQ